MVIAVDFDGTLYKGKNVYPDIGDQPNEKLIKKLKEYQKKGHALILWTCRQGTSLDEAVGWCASHDLYFDAINDNLPEIAALYTENSKKIFADIYIDDSSISPMKFVRNF